MMWPGCRWNVLIWNTNTALWCPGDTKALFQYPIRRFIVRSRKISKPRDLYLELIDRSKIWQAHRQHCCRCACQFSKQCNYLNYQSRSFEASRDLTIYKTFYRILKRGPGVIPSSGMTDYTCRSWNNRMRCMSFYIYLYEYSPLWHRRSKWIRAGHRTCASMNCVVIG